MSAYVRVYGGEFAAGRGIVRPESATLTYALKKGCRYMETHHFSTLNRSGLTTSRQSCKISADRKRSIDHDTNETQQFEATNSIIHHSSVLCLWPMALLSPCILLPWPATAACSYDAPRTHADAYEDAEADAVCTKGIDGHGAFAAHLHILTILYPTFANTPDGPRGPLPHVCLLMNAYVMELLTEGTRRRAEGGG